VSKLEIRELEPGGPIQLSGHAATFNQPYPVGSFDETILPGAFRRSLGEGPDVSLLVNHEGTPLARTTSGTMTLSEDATGLLVRAELEPSDPDVQAILPKMRRGDLSEMSFAFRATTQEWSDDKTERTIRACTIHRGDVSIVSSAANPNATASVRAQQMTLEQRERVAERVGNRVSGPYSMRIGDGFEDLAPPPRGRSQILVYRSQLDVIKARHAKLGGGSRRTSIGGSSVERAGLARIRSRLNVHDRPAQKEKYSQGETDRIGVDGAAFKTKSGTWGWPIASREDLLHAIKAWQLGRAASSDREAVRKYIVTRAIELKVTNLLPPGWLKVESATAPRPR